MYGNGKYLKMEYGYGTGTGFFFNMVRIRNRYGLILKRSTGTELIRNNLDLQIRVRNPYPSQYFGVCDQPEF